MRLYFAVQSKVTVQLLFLCFRTYEDCDSQMPHSIHPTNPDEMISKAVHELHIGISDHSEVLSDSAQLGTFFSPVAKVD